MPKARGPEQVGAMTLKRLNNGSPACTSCEEVPMRHNILAILSKAIASIEASQAHFVDDIVTIELLCCMTPDGDEEAEQTTAATKEMYARAKALLRTNGSRLDVSEHYDDDSNTAYNDAYARVPLTELFAVLKAFDSNHIEYDNIDLPIGTPRDTIITLRKRYPARSGVRVNTASDV